jgi:hypothetical protein
MTMEDAKGWLKDSEKTMIAMGAAMGGGCRKCAANLHKIALDQDILPEDMFSAFRRGLEAKAEALNTMREKVRSLLGDRQSGNDSPSSKDPKLASLIRIAAFTAANSAPDVFQEIEKARGQGVTERELKLCQSIARMVRDHAMKFSDQEIGEGISETSGPCSGACSCG